MIIGITGPSGAGKSTLSRYLKSKGFYIIDADLIVQNLYKKNFCLIEKIKKIFPFVVENSFVDKKKLAEVVFGDRLKLLTLEKIVNPFVLNVIKDEIEKNYFKCVIDAITLFESKANLFCDKTIAVVCKKDIRLERIIKRDKITKYLAEKRINSQQNDEFYIERADFLIENMGNLNEIEIKVKKFLELFNF